MGGACACEAGGDGETVKEHRSRRRQTPAGRSPAGDPYPGGSVPSFASATWCDRSLGRTHNTQQCPGQRAPDVSFDQTLMCSFINFAAQAAGKPLPKHAPVGDLPPQRLESVSLTGLAEQLESYSNACQQRPAYACGEYVQPHVLLLDLCRQIPCQLMGPLFCRA